jgi:hypothetical protein
MVDNFFSIFDASFKLREYISQSSIVHCMNLIGETYSVISYNDYQNVHMELRIWIEYTNILYLL